MWGEVCLSGYRFSSLIHCAAIWSNLENKCQPPSQAVCVQLAHPGSAACGTARFWFGAAEERVLKVVVQWTNAQSNVGRSFCVCVSALNWIYTFVAMQRLRHCMAETCAPSYTRGRRHTLFAPACLLWHVAKSKPQVFTGVEWGLGSQGKASQGYIYRYSFS